MNGTLQYSWFDWFRRKILTEFDQDVTMIKDYQPDITPIVYCCLQHKRVMPQKRKVILSDFFVNNEFGAKSEWLSLKKKIEDGVDINPYMSKNINDWRSVDYLLYTCNISHFHLHKGKQGGIRPELVFGVFTDDTFYAICIGDHNDIYSSDKLLSLADSSWPKSSIFNYAENAAYSSGIYSARDFKNFANNSNLQMNLLNPSVFANQYGVVKSLAGHQNTALIDYTLNGIDYGKIPYRVYCAYENEIEFISALDEKLYRAYGARNMSLTINGKNKKYIIKIHMQRQLELEYSVPRNRITCSLYDRYR